MSIVTKNGDGKYKVDWAGMVIFVTTSMLTGLIAVLGAYYGFQGKIEKNTYRIDLVEKITGSLVTKVGAMELKDAADSANFANACQILGEIKAQVNAIRDDQKRRYKTTGDR